MEKTRSGFTLIEVVVALVLLSATVLGLQMATGSMLRNMNTAQIQLTGAQLAEDRLDVIRIEPRYANLASYAGTETTIPGFPNFTRITTIVHTQVTTTLGTTDYKRVTVEVRNARLPVPIKRTLVIGAP